MLTTSTPVICSALPLLTAPPIYSSQFGGAIVQPGTTSLSLSLATEPVPAKLVDRIRSGAFVDMRDLLSDNVALMRHYETFHGALPIHILPGSARPRIREVNSLPSWVCAFLTYLAVRTTDPITRNQLTYARLVVRESLRHGGQGWLEYDRLFRQQAALDSSLQWNTIHPGLQATTILGQRSGGGTSCSICQECDHTPGQCAMAHVQQLVLPTNVRPQARLLPRRSGRQAPICMSWNEGSCVFPGTCTYHHICSVCHNPHRARDCKDSTKSRTPPSNPPSSWAPMSR